MGRTRFFKKTTGLPLGVIFFWGFYFLFSPFLHFHPSDVHAHDGDLQPHYHDGHFHSHELEALAHALNFHPSEEQPDQKHHQSHSSPEHDSDISEVNLNKAGVKHKNPSEISKHRDNVSCFSIPQSPSHQVKEIFLIEFPSANDPDPFHERSPPVFSF